MITDIIPKCTPIKYTSVGNSLCWYKGHYFLVGQNATLKTIVDAEIKIDNLQELGK